MFKLTGTIKDIYDDPNTNDIRIWYIIHSELTKKKTSKLQIKQPFKKIHVVGPRAGRNDSLGGSWTIGALVFGALMMAGFLLNQSLFVARF